MPVHLASLVTSTLHRLVSRACRVVHKVKGVRVHVTRAKQGMLHAAQVKRSATCVDAADMRQSWHQQNVCTARMEKALRVRVRQKHHSARPSRRQRRRLARPKPQGRLLHVRESLNTIALWASLRG